eukprot:7989857-Pyramimonas_sp.AAC.1
MTPARSGGPGQRASICRARTTSFRTLGGVQLLLLTYVLRLSTPCQGSAASEKGRQGRGRTRRAAALRSQLYRDGLRTVGIQEGRNEKGEGRSGE